MKQEMCLREASEITRIPISRLQSWAKSGEMEASGGGRGSPYIVTAQALQNAVLGLSRNQLGLAEEDFTFGFPVLTDDDLVFHTEEAYHFYFNHFINIEKQKIIKRYNFPITGSISSFDWELLGAILTGEKRSEGYGSDLGRFEIKSAVWGNSFEYQYHLNRGKEKLLEDMAVGHVFISYSRDYKDITVRFVYGLQLSKQFITWIPDLLKNYRGSNPRQRYRKSINFSYVTEIGIVIMKIRDGQLLALS